MEHVLVTGGAGFIGSHLVDRLLRDGHRVTALDSFDDFYDPAVKHSNVRQALSHPAYRLIEGDIRDATALSAIPAGRIDAIVHLAARAGVRPSIEQPELYTSVNVSGTVSMLEFARAREVQRFVFGSSSSVYGTRHRVPFREDEAVDHPISPYAATKRAGELLCDTYSHLFGTAIASLRFFTVYGPRQRPDLAIHKFTKLILADRPVPVFGDGSMRRDFTFVDDIVEGLMASIRWTVGGREHDLFNLGASTPVTVLEMVEAIGAALGKRPRVEFTDLQPGDVTQTYADISKARTVLGYNPSVSFPDGIGRFVRWARTP